MLVLSDFPLPLFFCFVPLKITNLKMTEKMLSSTNQDPAHNGSTLVLDLTEQLSYIVQEPNIFITHLVSDVAIEIDQSLGHLKTVSGCN